MRTVRLTIIIGFFITSTFGVFGQDNKSDSIPSVLAGKAETHTTVEQTNSGSDEVYMVVEDMPEFPGGNDSMMKFISNNLVYPKVAKENKIQGYVVLQFIVDEEGKIINARVLKGIGHGCDEEALRVIHSMPKWKPGKQRGKAVSTYSTIPIIFKLQ